VVGFAAGAGALLLGWASATVLGGVLAFGAMAFLDLGTEELLVQAHVESEPASAASAVRRFLIHLVLTELIG
jgi:ZIP family zinc transporter